MADQEDLQNPDLNLYVPRSSPMDIQEHPDAITPERTTLETFGSAFDLAKKDTLVEAGLRLQFRGLLQQNEMDEALTPDQINREFPELEGEFTRPMNRAVVEDVLRSTRERRELQQKIDQGPKTFGSRAAQFGAGLLAHATDPGELLGGFILGAGVGVAGGALGLTRLGFGTARATLTQTFLRNTAEAGVANILAEPIIAAGSASDLQEYTVADMMTSVIAGTIAGGVISTGISRGADIMHTATGPGMRTWIMNNAVLNVASDRIPMVDSMRKVLLKTLTDVNPEGLSMRGLQPYERVNIVSPEGVVKRSQRLYGATKSWGDSEFATASRHTLGDDFGDGTITVTDNPYMANNYAAQVFEERQGGVFHVQAADDLRLIDLDAPLNLESDLGKSLKTALDGFFGEKQVESLLQASKGLTGREAFDLLRGTDFDMNKLNASLKEAGYDGYVHNNSRVAGQVAPESNVLVLFSPEKLEQVGKSAPDQKLVGKLSKKEELEIRQEAEKPDTLYNTEAEIKEADEFFKASQRNTQPEPDSEANVKEITETIEQDLAEIEFAAKSGLLGAEELEGLAAIKQMDAFEERYVQMVNMIKSEVCGE